MCDDAMEHVSTGKFLIDVGGIDVTGHHREELNILRLQSTHQLGAIANGDIIPGTILDVLQAVAGGCVVNCLSFSGWGEWLTEAE